MPLWGYGFLLYDAVTKLLCRLTLLWNIQKQNIQEYSKSVAFDKGLVGCLGTDGDHVLSVEGGCSTQVGGDGLARSVSAAPNYKDGFGMEEVLLLGTLLRHLWRLTSSCSSGHGSGGHLEGLHPALHWAGLLIKANQFHP